LAVILPTTERRAKKRGKRGAAVVKPGGAADEPPIEWHDADTRIDI
jgi:hypothetical protein